MNLEVHPWCVPKSSLYMLGFPLSVFGSFCVGFKCFLCEHLILPWHVLGFSLCTFNFPLCVSSFPWHVLGSSLCTFGFPLCVFGSSCMCGFSIFPLLAFGFSWCVFDFSSCIFGFHLCVFGFLCVGFWFFLYGHSVPPWQIFDSFWCKFEFSLCFFNFFYVRF